MSCEQPVYHSSEIKSFSILALLDIKAFGCLSFVTILLLPHTFFYSQVVLFRKSLLFVPLSGIAKVGTGGAQAQPILAGAQPT